MLGVVPAVAQDLPQYDEFGLRPPEPNTGLALPDEMLDPRWMFPDPGTQEASGDALTNPAGEAEPVVAPTVADEIPMPLPPLGAAAPVVEEPSVPLPAGPLEDNPEAEQLFQEDQLRFDDEFADPAAW